MLLAAGCVDRKQTRMKTKLILPLVLSALLCGCATTPAVRDAAYVQSKAQKISLLVAGAALVNNPQPELADKLTKVVAELRQVTQKDQVSVDDLTGIALRIPQVANSKYGFAIAAGQLVFEDELQRLAIKNPELLRAAGIGMANGIEAALNASK